MDDPLSAVDTKVSKHIFDKAICTELKTCTRILVTHQVQYLASPHVTNVVVIADGSIKAQGSYHELMSQGKLDWIKGMKEEEEVDEDVERINDQTREGISQGKGYEINKPIGGIAMLRARSRSQSTSSVGSHSRQSSLDKSTDENTNIPLKTSDIGVELTNLRYDGENIEEGLIIAEDREAGAVTKQTYMSYIQHMGGGAWTVVLLILMASGQCFAIATNLFLARWSRMDKTDQHATDNYIIYGSLVGGTILTACIRSYYGFRSTVFASYSLHNSMLHAVVRAPILFFDQNPIGRVLNRFAKDVGCIDDQLPMTLFDFTQCVMMVLAGILIVCSAVPITFLCLIPLIYYFIRLRSYYILSSREIKRLDGISRSPILSLLTETLDGLATVRAYGKEETFCDNSKLLIDNNTKAYFSFIACSRWLGFHLDVIVTVLLLVASFGAVIAKDLGASVNSDLLAVGLLYVIQLSGLFQWCIRQSCEVENMMTSVERVLGFTELPSEPPLYGSLVETKWPDKGHIKAHQLECRYRSDLEPVIKKIDLEIYPGQKVGIVGRTGAGKSTIVAALLRLVDISHGSITMDGKDICEVGLHELRPKISVIPQTPFLFSGKLRDNLDPFGKYTDEEIWSAIDASGTITRKIVEKIDGHLSGIVEESGGNFSVGERQLLCLARAVLSKNKIIIMDEATANLDNETDAAVQESIRRNFADSTVIIIAHRLQTIMDCNQVIVMSHGTVAEAGHPYNLLTKYFGNQMGSSFSSIKLNDSKAPPRESLAGMVQETGPIMTTFLSKMAYTAYQNQKIE